MKIRYTSVMMLVLAIALTGCSNNSQINSNAVVDTEHEINIDKLEIYHFHGTSQCYSCITMGDYAEATVNTYFKDEIEKGIIVFDHINGQLPENRELVIKYGATGSSLWIGTYDDEDFSAEQNINVWYKIQDKSAYMDYLKGVIEQKLAGN